MLFAFPFSATFLFKFSSNTVRGGGGGETKNFAKKSNTGSDRLVGTSKYFVNDDATI